jgi:hypothetical protein
VESAAVYTGGEVARERRVLARYRCAAELGVYVFRELCLDVGTGGSRWWLAQQAASDLFGYILGDVDSPDSLFLALV